MLAGPGAVKAADAIADTIAHAQPVHKTDPPSEPFSDDRE